MVKFITNRNDHQVTLPTSNSLEELSNYISRLSWCGLDLETTGLIFNHDQVLLLVLGNKENSFVVDYTSFGKDDLTKLLKSIKCKIIGHNLRFDLPFLLHRHGRYLFRPSQIYDTMIAEQVLIKGTSKSASLLNTAKRRLGLYLFDKKIRNEFIGMSKTNPTFADRHVTYASDDIKYLGDIADVQGEFIKKYRQEELLDYNNAVTLVSSQMQVDGMPVDTDDWIELYYANIKEADKLEVEMDMELERIGLKQRKKRIKQRTVQLDFLGGTTDVVNKNVDNINYGSSSQVIDIFICLGEPVPKSAKEDKNSIGEATLQQYLIKHPHTKLKNFIEMLLRYKDVGKKANTFGKKWIDKFVVDGRVHSNFKVNSTATGRFSSSSPNCQNLPSDKKFRSCFKAKGENYIFTCDYSSAELRILASLSKDEVMLELLRNGADLHGYAATQAYRFLYREDDAIVDKNNHPEFRTKMKNVIFGLLYGAGVQRIAELLDISKNKAESVYKILQKTFPQAFDYLEKVASFGTSNGYVLVDSKWNQRRWFEEFFKGNLTNAQRSAIERYSKNTPIQAQNGQMMKKALVDVYNYIEENNLKSRIISTVHDEMVIEVDKDELHHTDQFALLMKLAGDYFLEGVEIEAEPVVLKHWSK